jgi:hypothetical protein
MWCNYNHILPPPPLYSPALKILSKASALLKGALVSNKREVLSYLSSTKQPPKQSDANWDSTVLDLLVKAAAEDKDGGEPVYFAKEKGQQMFNDWEEPVQLYNLHP